jgi:adenylate cyclase class 2
MPQHSSHEIEIKLAVPDSAAVRRRLRALGARAGPRLHEANLLFDTPDGSLRSREMLLRIRVERPARRVVASKSREERIALLDAWMFPSRGRQAAIVTFKGPPLAGALADAAPQDTASHERGNYKIRREIEFGVSDALGFREILAALRFQPAFYYEKLRTSYRVPAFRGLLISFDQTPAGSFLELEGLPASIDRARHALGYRPEEAILLSYGALFAERRRAAGLPMTDMLFVQSG